MPKHGKKYRHAASLLPKGIKFEEPERALELVKESAFASFDETVEISVRLGVDPRHADQIVRGTVVLPHGTGKTVRVLALAEGAQAQAAEEAGADYVGMEYVDKIKEGWLEFDVVVAAPNVMGQVGQLGRILGPRGLMPTPKAGTVTMDVGTAVEEVKAGKIEFRVDRTGNVHVPIGKVSFELSALTENMAAVMDVILRQRPASAKGAYVRSVTVSSTMGPGVGIDPNLYRRVAA
ncbi:MAG: 50S ribosomal protein L1 [Gemmatimonadota bacterium]|jgi:large subunit ribosomal protein L1